MTGPAQALAHACFHCRWHSWKLWVTQGLLPIPFCLRPPVRSPVMLGVLSALEFSSTQAYINKSKGGDAPGSRRVAEVPK